ncbi:hypothetical protein [Streptomyces kanamyceticus]|uniref:hypothetical protein n=1 Tax=Streptomyces kanamyceticus TaxID=1967 RepID=UPI000AB75382|nr:hypothetical protein [Streptomyces kanamyceticus]
MLLVDLSTVAPRERADAFHHALADSLVPNEVVHEEPETGIHARMELWQVGGLGLFSTRNSGFEVRRNDRYVRHHRSRPVISARWTPSGWSDTEITGRLR